MKWIKVCFNVPLISWRNPLLIPRYIKTYSNLPQPQWGDPSKNIGFWRALWFWWIIEDKYPSSKGKPSSSLKTQEGEK